MTVLEEAAKLVDSERREVYGPPEDEFQRIATMWSAVLGVQVTAKQVCMCMIATKLMRLSVSPEHRDSLVDICGYARVLEMQR